MISKIIQKEKKRQEEYLNNCCSSYETGMKESHEQSLINLKEFMEEVEDIWEESGNCGCNDSHSEFGNQLEENIKELTKMIEVNK